MSLSQSLIFRTMLNQSSDLIFVLDENMICKEINTSSGKLLNRFPDEMQDTLFVEIFKEVQQVHVRRSIEESRIAGKENRFQAEASDRTPKFVELDFTVVWSPEDRLYYGSAREIAKDDSNPVLDEYESFQYLFQDSPMPMIIWDFETLKIVELNQEAQKKYGYTREEFLETDITQIRPKEDIPLILEAAKSEESYSKVKRRWRHLTKTGELLYVEVYTKIVPFRGRRSALVHLNDVTEKVRSEEELLKAYKKVSDYKFALDESTIVAITDAAGIITYVNDNFRRISKYGRAELIGQNHRLINSGFHDKQFFRDLWRIISAGEVWRGEIKNQAKDGTYYWVDSTIVPFLNEMGVPYQYMAVRFDITEKKKSEENISIKTNLLEAIAKVISVLFKYDDWELALDNSFGIVGEAVSVDRVYYFENYFYPETNEGFANQKLEWAAVNTHPQLNNPELQDLPFVMIQDFIIPLSDKKPFIAIVSQMPHSQTKELLMAQHIKSILVLPIFIKDYFYGFIGFDDCNKEREWREDEISFLKTLTSKLASAIEKRRNLLDLQNALREKSHILESIDDAFFAVDKNWIVTYWNKKAEYILGTKKEDILGKNLWSIYQKEKASIFYDFYHKSLTENVPSHFETFYDHLGRWLEVSAYPSSSGLSVFFKDISARKETEQSLQKSNKELALSNSELEQFAFVASHDLQEPLRMITSFLSQLEKKYENLLDDRGRKYIYFASDGARRMRNIILDLLEFSRIGRTDESKQTIVLKELLEEVTGLNRKLIQEKKATVTWVSDLPDLYTFRSALRLIFQNLINNGLKYQAEGARPVITIAYKETDSSWQFIISDNGIGIDSDYFEKIFTIFQRLHNKDEYSGTGVGLAICKKIVENLEGEIWVTSEPGKGSQFHFSLPK